MIAGSNAVVVDGEVDDLIDQDLNAVVVGAVFNGVASDGEFKAIRLMSAMEDLVFATISEL
mgnify:CR=1 FL=1